MKKLICFIIIAVAAAFVFFTGWTQIKIKPDTIGVVQSKIKGVNPEAVVPGKFTWNWEFLIPTNAKLNVFDYKPYNHTKTITGTVSSGDAFSSTDLLGYRFTYSVTLSYTPEAVVHLLSENSISCQEDLDLYLSNACDAICQKATNYYLNKVSEDSSFKPETIKREELIKGISSYTDFPDLDVLIIALTDYKLPNYVLYNKLQNQNSYFTNTNQTLQPDNASTTEPESQSATKNN